ncbi:hypothetical protein EOD23_17245, partial [Mesorhizobium sp. USDA-HM6]
VPTPPPFPDPKPMREPDPERLPDEEPVPNPDENDVPPKHSGAGTKSALERFTVSPFHGNGEPLYLFVFKQFRTENRSHFSWNCSSRNGREEARSAPPATRVYSPRIVAWKVGRCFFCASIMRSR